MADNAANRQHFWLICPRCKQRKLTLHCCGCWECVPAVPPGTPNSKEIAWEAWITGALTA